MSILAEFSDFKNIKFSDYREFNLKLYSELKNTVKSNKSKSVLHINATPLGGGVSEILHSEIPFERSLGLDSHWLNIEAPAEFFSITKKIHNLLQGKNGILTEKEKSFYISTNRRLKDSLEKFLNEYRPTTVVIHDPQPMPLIDYIPKQIYKILRFHIDLSAPDKSMLNFLKPFINSYDLVVLSNKIYRLPMPWLKPDKTRIIMPAINPLSVKNRPMSAETANLIVSRFGINPKKHLIAQISRFDVFKDPLGVIKAYYLAKNKIPDLQLALAGFFFAQDDPEAREIFEKVKKHDRGDPDIFLFSNPKKLRGISNDIFISALYTASKVVIQKSIREGFGLTITEAMWKEKVVIAGKTIGASAQIKNGQNGVIINSPEEAAKAIVRLIKNEKLRKRLGKAARQSVKNRFLLPRFILDNIKIYR